MTAASSPRPVQAALPTPDLEAAPVTLPAISGTAQLLTDPKKALTKTGKPMATVLLKFAAWRKVDGKWEEGDSVVASAIAFEDTARALAAFSKGDNVAVTGLCTLTVWQDKPRLNLTVQTCAAPERRTAEQVAA
jgi:single-stranded DNA-binding protein